MFYFYIIFFSFCFFSALYFAVNGPEPAEGKKRERPDGAPAAYVTALALLAIYLLAGRALDRRIRARQAQAAPEPHAEPSAEPAPESPAESPAEPAPEPPAPDSANARKEDAP